MYVYDKRITLLLTSTRNSTRADRAPRAENWESGEMVALCQRRLLMNVETHAHAQQKQPKHSNFRHHRLTHLLHSPIALETDVPVMRLNVGVQRGNRRRLAPMDCKAWRVMRDVYVTMNDVWICDVRKIVKLPSWRLG